MTNIVIQFKDLDELLPSDQEEILCRQSFGVPHHARREEGGTSITLRWPS